MRLPDHDVDFRPGVTEITDHVETPELERPEFRLP